MTSTDVTVIVVSSCIMDVAVVMKTELVTKSSSEVDDLIKVTNVEVVVTMLDDCLSELFACSVLFSRVDSLVLTFSRSVLETLRDVNIFVSNLWLVLHL